MGDASSIADDEAGSAFVELEFIDGLAAVVHLTRTCMLRLKGSVSSTNSRVKYQHRDQCGGFGNPLDDGPQSQKCQNIFEEFEHDLVVLLLNLSKALRVVRFESEPKGCTPGGKDQIPTRAGRLCYMTRTISDETKSAYHRNGVAGMSRSAVNAVHREVLA